MRSFRSCVIIVMVVSGWCMLTQADTGKLGEGSLVGWGTNDHGQCTVPAGTDFTQVSAGDFHCLAMKHDGSLAGWGINTDGQSTVPAGIGFTQVSAGGWNGLALKDDGSLAGWGHNLYGQSTVPAGTNFTQVSGGNIHSLALKDDGSLETWGSDSYGHLSNMPAGTNFTLVAAGGFHSLALKDDGSIVAWGFNSSGQVSDAPTTSYFLDISVGGYHSLALKASQSYEDLDVSGAGAVLLLQRPVTVSGDATISAMMTMENNPTMTVGGLVTVQGTGGVSGAGTVDGDVWAQANSRIEATGTLALGDASSAGGFVGEGRIEIGSHIVTINNRVMTPVGQTVLIDGGTLNVDNGMIVEPGSRLMGAGEVNGRVVNHGLIAAGAPGDDLVFNGLVSGAGSFIGSIVFDGGFSPGNSPASLHLDWATFGPDAALTMELAGTIAGTEYDHLDVLETAALDGTLNVELLYGFAPEDGQVFDLFDGTLSGAFDTIALPTLTGRKTWDTSDLYTNGEISVIGMLPGDTDIDWDVDTEDYNTFVSAFGGEGDWQTDFNEDGRVDLADFAIIRGNFGTSVGTSPLADATAVTPEPATMILLGLGGLTVLRRRRLS